MDALRWLWGYLKKYRLRLFCGYIATVLLTILALFVPYIIGQIVDRVLLDKNYEILKTLIIVLISLTLVRTGGVYFRTLNFEWISQKTIHKIRSDIYKILNHLDFSFYDKNKTGSIMSRMTGDLNAVRQFISGVSPQLFKNIMIVLVTLVMIFLVNVKFALIIALVAPFIFIASQRFSKEVRPLFFEVRQQFSKLNTVVQENISGNRVVKGFVREDFEIQKFDKENNAFKEKMLSVAKSWERHLPKLDFLSQFMLVITILAGGILVIQNLITYGELVTFNTLVLRVSMSLRRVGWLINDVQNFIASSNKIIQIIDSHPSVSNKGLKLKKHPLKGKIEFKNVSFKYENELILKNISFVVNPGETAAFIGSTGSGKSTIMNLICRFYDATEGLVLIDEIDVKNIDLKTLRSNISIAMQDVFLFTDTIKNNISYGMPGANIDEIKRVAKIAHAHDFIKKMPEGYNTVVGERGVGLSGGQKQRIALARTLLINAPILILDDTTSSLDVETENEIQKTLEEYSKKRTTLIITHRISSVKKADKIFVIENGVIVESGNHKELLEKKNFYYNIYINQTTR